MHLPSSRALLLAVTCGLLAGCATPTAGPQVPATPSDDLVSYQCQDGVRFRARLQEDGAQLEGLPGGPDRLLRDAGGLTPRQRVYSGTRLRAEFGLGVDGGAAVLHVLQPQLATLRCTLR